MSDINRAILVGRLTADPELRATAAGTPVASFSVAVNGREKQGGEWQERVDYFDVTVWDAQGEACAQHLSRGQRVAVEGRLRQEKWETDGQKRSKVTVVASSVQFLEKAGGGAGEQQERAAAPAPAVPADDDIPF